MDITVQEIWPDGDDYNKELGDSRLYNIITSQHSAHEQETKLGN